MFRGLFIGVDRYASPAINWLSCARRDAVALHALFSDTLGGSAALLVDDDATRANIEKSFANLSACSQDDFVVIAFSGHGTETHEIVTYDADISALNQTCIPLDLLSEWFAKIPARNLVFVLDCCFSGGMGAKALRVDARPRDLPSTDILLQHLSGEGRIILTASLATERAWENQKLGHGLLTFHLIRALQGPEEVAQGDRVPVYRLLDFVTRRVIDNAATLGHTQQPTLRGTVNGELIWPIFRPGPLFNVAFPEQSRTQVTTDIHSLATYGFPTKLLDTWKGSIQTFNALQLDAINQFGLLDGEHLVVSAPTSSGKTMIGELAALRGALDRKRAFFLFPLKALVNDKFRHFNESYGGFGIRTIRATGDTTADEIVPLMRGQYDICLMTYEKCAALLLGSPHLLEQVGTIVIDEVQMVADPSRGVNLEFLLTMLRLRRRAGTDPQIIALSAVIGDTNGLERWLGARLLRRTERPVPLDEGILQADGSFRYVSSETGDEKTIANLIQPQLRKGSSQDFIIPLVQKLARADKSVIVFRETKGEARGCAKYLAEIVGLPAAQAALDTLPDGDPSLSSRELRQTLQGGVGFHIADLDPDERQVIEEQFRSRPSTLKVLAATTTLAMGVNTPAEAVVIAGLEHPGNNPYSIAEYKNMVGRAGRLGFTARGESYLIAANGRDEHYLWTRYIRGNPEDLLSHFLSGDTDPRSVILRVLTTAEHAGPGIRPDDIIGFLEESFGVVLQKQRIPAWRWDRALIDRALNELARHKLVELSPEGMYQLTELGRLSGVTGVEVESIIRVVSALSGIDPGSISDPALIAASQLTMELDQVLFPINKKSTQKEPQTWFNELRGQGVANSIMSGLSHAILDAHQPTLRAKKAVACLLWISGRPISEIENILTQFGGRFNGAAGPIRSVKSRTCDVLPAIAKIAELVHPGLSLGNRMQRLLTRLEIGIPAVAADLATFAGDSLSRADYLQLTKAELVMFAAIEVATDEALSACVSQNRAKLKAIRAACRRARAEQSRAHFAEPILAPYQP
jgi:replicative superfamily II helicase